jgi:hypothetical protein
VYVHSYQDRHTSRSSLEAERKAAAGAHKASEEEMTQQLLASEQVSREAQLSTLDLMQRLQEVEAKLG